MNYLANSSLETKGELETKEGNAPDVEKAVAELQAAFETKITALTNDVKAANDNVAAATRRADALEIKFGRPGTGAANDNEPSLETKAFNRFVREGKEALSTEEIKSLRVSSDPAGGYLATGDFVAELDRNVVQFSPVRQVASVRATGSGSIVWPRRTSGMTATWVGEVAPRMETTVTFGQATYTVYELAAYVDVSNMMLEDSVFDVPGLLAFEFAEEFGKKESTAFVNGLDLTSPAGFMNDNVLAYTPGGAASALTADGLIDIYHAVPAAYRGNAVWGMNSATLAGVRKLKDTTGNYLLSLTGLAGAVATTILGRPVIEMPDLPDVGAGTFPVVFGDFAAGYRIFDRVSLSILRDPYSQAANGLTRFHGRRRVAGGVGKAEAIRKLKIATA